MLVGYLFEKIIIIFVNIIVSLFESCLVNFVLSFFYPVHFKFIPNIHLKCLIFSAKMSKILSQSV